MPKVSVAMSSYNHAPYVGEAIESVLSQDCDFDFSIVDDGSKDATVNEIRKYNDPRIKFVALPKNEGACAALRKAIEGGSGEYVAILNSDDKFLPGKLKRQANFLDTHPEIHAVFAYPQFINNEGKILESHQHFYKTLFSQPNRTRYEWLYFFFYNYNVLCHPTLMIRRECYEKLGYYDPRLAQIPDFEFWVRLLLKYNIHILSEELIQFRILGQEANMSSPRPSSQNRENWELPIILDHFTTIRSINEFVKIFPLQSGTAKDPELIPFYLAQMALQVERNKNIYWYWALRQLHTLLAKPVLVEKLKSIGFTYADYIKLTGLKPVFLNTENSFFERLKKYNSPQKIIKKACALLNNQWKKMADKL